jgi:hypothetical protein
MGLIMQKTYSRDYFRREIQKAKDEIKTWPKWAQESIIASARFPEVPFKKQKLNKVEEE